MIRAAITIRNYMNQKKLLENMKKDALLQIEKQKIVIGIANSHIKYHKAVLKDVLHNLKNLK